MRRQVADATEAAAAAAREIRRAGNIKDLDVTEQEALAGQAKLDLDAAEAELAQDRERLNVLMGLAGADTQWSLDGRLPDPPATEPSRDGLESYALDRRFDLVTARREVEAASQTLGLTRASRLFPDARIGAHFEREPQGEKTVGPSIELPIPLLDQGQGRVAREYALFRQARRRYEAMTAEAQSQVRAAHARMAAARRRADYYRTAVLPLNARLLDQTQRQFNAMQVGVFQLIQAKQSQIEAGRAYIEALRDYWLARTELEKAVGGRLPAQTSEC
jgi:cobalt-zinc-cadmium efflux system outer membrane protein